MLPILNVGTYVNNVKCTFIYLYTGIIAKSLCEVFSSKRSQSKTESIQP